MHTLKSLAESNSPVLNKVHSMLKKVNYFNLVDAVNGTIDSPNELAPIEYIGTVIVSAVLTNGMVVIGQAHSFDLEKYDDEIGKALAFNNLVEVITPMAVCELLTEEHKAYLENKK